MKWDIAIIALAVLAVASLSRALSGTPVTAPMVFVAIGVLLGPPIADGITLSPGSESVRTLAEATLAVVLFADASRINLRRLREEYSVPLRLLGIGLPLTIATGAVVAAGMLHELTLAEAAVLAIVLAPTDAALGQAVVTEPRLPSRIRQGLNVESGLNDGICVPLLLIALAIADVDSSTESAHSAVRIIAEEVGYGIVGGVAAGLVATAVIVFFHRRKLVSAPWLQVVPVAGAALAYGLAAGLGGSGFIAAFLAGGLFGSLVSREAQAASRLNEELGDLLGGITFLIFGAIMFAPALERLSWTVGAYAVASLTIARMLPVAIAMIGSGARWQTVTFVGWFGPRGLASIVFAVIAVREAQLPGANTILTATYLTIGISVFAHGLTAAPLARRYAHWYEGHPRESRPAMESRPAAAHRSRADPVRLTQ